MAQLNDTMVQGDLRVTGKIFADTASVVGNVSAHKFTGLLDDSASRVGIGYNIISGNITFNVDKTYAEIKSVISNNDRNNTYVSIRYLGGGHAAGINYLLPLSAYDEAPNNTTTLSFTGINNNVLHYATISPSDEVTYNQRYLVTSDSAQTSADFEPMLTSARGVSKYLGGTAGSIIGIHDDNERGGAGIYGIAFNANGCVRWNGTSYVIQKITPAESNGNQDHQFNGIANYAYNALSATYATTAGSATNATNATNATKDSAGNNISSTYLKLSGGTMTGVLKAKGSVYEDNAGAGALDMQNSNIINVNSIYTSDTSDNASEGIHFCNDAKTKCDTIWANGGTLYFVPQRSIGTGTSAANSERIVRSSTITKLVVGTPTSDANTVFLF